MVNSTMITNNSLVGCAALLRAKGKLHDYVILSMKEAEQAVKLATNGSQLCINAEGLARTTRLVGFHQAPDTVITGIMTAFDATNRLLSLSYCDGAFVHTKRVHLDEVLDINPRLRYHPLCIELQHEGDRVRLPKSHDPHMPLFATEQELALYYTRQPLQLRCWEREGDVAPVRLRNSLNKVKLSADELNKSFVRQVEQSLPLNVSAALVDALMAQHWCQAGDFLIRRVQPDEEAAANALYSVCLMAAIRVHHAHIYVNDEGLYWFKQDPDAMYPTLCELIDHIIIHERFEGIPLRRIVHPSAESLSLAQERVEDVCGPSETPAQFDRLMGSDLKRSRPDNYLEASRPSNGSNGTGTGSPQSLTVPIASMTVHGGDWGPSSDFDEDTVYSADVRNIAFITEASKSQFTDDENEQAAQGHPVLQLGLGGEVVHTVKRPTGRRNESANAFMRRYLPMGLGVQIDDEQASDVPQADLLTVWGRSKTGTFMRSRNASAPPRDNPVSGFVIPEHQVPPPRARPFSWSGLLKNSAQSEIDDVFD